MADKRKIEVEIDDSALDKYTAKEKEEFKQGTAKLKEEEARKTLTLKDELNTRYSNLKSALQKELIAMQGGKELVVKEAIAQRKLMESELRTFEATFRNSLSKELADFKATKDAELVAQKQLNKEILNAPRTNLRGAVGSEAYTRQIQSAQTKFLPGSQEFQQSGMLIEKYKTQLKTAGVEVQSLSQKIGKELTASLVVQGKTTEAVAEKTSLFRQRSINLGADLTVLAFGVRGIISDFKGLTAELRTGDAGIARIAETSGMATLQFLSMVPALLAIKKAIPNNEFTQGAKATGIFAIALADLVNKAVTAIDAFQRMRSGGEGFFQAIGNALSNNTIGQLTKEILGLKSAADLVTEAMNRMQMATNNAVRNSQIKEMNRRKELGLTPDDIAIVVNMDKQTADLKDANKVDKVGGSLGAVTEKEKEILNLIELQNIQLDKANIKLEANRNDLGAERDIRIEILNIEREIYRLRYGIDLNKKLPDAMGFDSPALNLRPGYKRSGFGGDINPRSKDIEDMERSELLTNAMLNGFIGMDDLVASMLQKTGLMDSDFGKIVQMIQGLIGTGKDVFSFGSLIGDLISFIPGGNVVGGISGGGLKRDNVNIGNFSSGGSRAGTQPIILKGDWSKYAEIKILNAGQAEYQAELADTTL